MIEAPEVAVIRAEEPGAGGTVLLLQRRAHDASAWESQDRFGKIFRRNMPYGTVPEHGTMFVGFSADQRRLADMLDSMAALHGGVAAAGPSPIGAAHG